MFIIFGVILLSYYIFKYINMIDYKEKADTSSTKFISEKAPRGKNL